MSAGLARGACVAQVVLAAAEGTDSGPLTPQREALRELVRASGLARRIGINLNQAVARLNATGQRSGDLLPYARECLRQVSDWTPPPSKSARPSGEPRPARPGAEHSGGIPSRVANRPGPEMDDPGRGGDIPAQSGNRPVIGKISAPRGKRVEPLIWCLLGPGRHEEHTDPHIIAGWRHPAELEPPLRPDGKRDFRMLTGLLKQPYEAMGSFGLARPVWHCAVRAAPSDRMLSDDEWAHIAHDVMHRTGLAPHGQEDDAVRWIAVRHFPIK